MERIKGKALLFPPPFFLSTPFKVGGVGAIAGAVVGLEPAPIEAEDDRRRVFLEIGVTGAVEMEEVEYTQGVGDGKGMDPQSRVLEGGRRGTCCEKRYLCIFLTKTLCDLPGVFLETPNPI